MLEIVIENKKFVDITQQCFVLLPQVNFPDNNCIFTQGEGDEIESRLSFLNPFYFIARNFKVDVPSKKHAKTDMTLFYQGIY